MANRMKSLFGKREIDAILHMARRQHMAVETVENLMAVI
jgi:hypothetical protein